MGLSLMGFIFRLMGLVSRLWGLSNPYHVCHLQYRVFNSLAVFFCMPYPRPSSLKSHPSLLNYQPSTLNTQPFNPQPRSTQVLGLNTFSGKWLQQSVPIQQSEFIHFQG